MKKIVSLILALIICTSLCVNASAYLNIDRIFVNADNTSDGINVYGDDPIEIKSGDKLYILGWAFGTYENLKEIVYSIDDGEDISCPDNYRDRMDVPAALGINSYFGIHAGFGHDDADDGGLLELTGIDTLGPGEYKLTIKAIYNDDTFDTKNLNLKVEADAVKINGLTFKSNDSFSECYVFSCDEDISGDVIIPSSVEFNGKPLPVTSIYCSGWWNSAFYRRSNIKNITIPDSVTKIGEYAFNGCSSLTSITIPGSITEIGSYAFEDCKSLTSVSIPDSVTEIGEYAFNGCSSLTNLSIPDSVTSIGNGAFSDCYSLTSITIPGSVTEIGRSAFSDCSGLKNVNIPGSVTEIGRSAFSGCSGLKSVNIPGSVTSIGEYAFYGCSSLTSIKIPNSVTSIGEYAFYGCSNLTSVTIPDSVTSIGDGAFSDCNALESIIVSDNNKVYYSKGNCLIETKSKTLILGCKNSVIPDDGSVTSIGSSAFEDCKSLTSVNIPDGVTSIGDWAFADCSGITSMNIPNSVMSIGRYAFCGCSGIANVNIPDSVTSIGGSAFYRCSNIKSITIPDSVTSIGWSAFSGCSSLTSVSIPNSVTEIVYCEFYGCSNLTNITIPDSVTSIGEYAFSYCRSLTNVSIPDNVTLIDEAAFYSCSGLTNVSIPDNVTEIGWSAFRNCSGLKSVTIGKGVTSIPYYMFGGCSELESITVSDKNEAYHSKGNCLIETESKTLKIGCKNSVIPDDGSVTSIGSSAFEDCKSLTSVSIPDGVTSIYWDAFEGCSGLKSVTISGSVTSIGDDAFDDCNSLETVYYNGNEEQWNKIDINYGNDYLKNASIIFNYKDAAPGTTWFKDLTGVDYLAFAALAYENPKGSIGKAVGDFIGKKLRHTYDNTDYNYGNLCENIIYWTVFDYEETNEETGFTAITFTNGYEYVIAFEGSNGKPLDFNDTGAFKDWWINDFPAYAGTLTSQVPQAINYYGKILEKAGNNKSKIHLAGHSLGGGLADIVSAYSGSYAETFNAAPFVSVAYSQMPDIMNILFNGVDEWNFYDHVNLEDYFIGSWAYTYKNCMLHKHEGYTNDELFAPHSLQSFIKKKVGNSDIELTDFQLYKTSESVERKQVPLADKPSANRFKDEYSKNSFWKDALSSTMVFFSDLYTLEDTLKYLYLGDTRGNTKRAGYWSSWVFFGGDGKDTLNASNAGGNCVFVGGKGDDYLTGSKKDDVYYYYYEKDDYDNGDGYDTISDKSGKADIYLLNCDKDDDVAITEDNEYFYISINSHNIIRIIKGNRSDDINVYVYDSEFNKIDETSVKFQKKWFKTSYTIACPVNIVIYDAEGQPVYEVPNYEDLVVNDYGVFISYYETYGDYEEYGYTYTYGVGERIHEFDLADGYYPVITGYDEGTMNVYVEKDGEEDVFGAIDIPVSDAMTAELKENESGDMILSVDNDSDGETDDVLTLTDAVATIKITTDYEPFASEYEERKALIGETIQIDASLDLESDFIGWYENGELISEEVTLEYAVKGDAEIKAVYKPKTVAGDCNGDGEVDNKDVVMLFRYVSGDNKADDESVYDFNGDGEVDNKDVVALFREVSAS